MKQTVTLIYFRDKTGKVRSVVLSLGVFNLLVAALILMPVLSILLSLTAYYKGAPISNILSGLVERNITQLVKVTEAPLPDKKTVAEEKPAAVETEKTSPEPPAKDETETAPEPGAKIMLENIQTTELEDAGGLSIKFNLSRTELSSSDKLTGFVFVLYKVNGVHLTVPENSKIKNGMPAHYKNGENFFIKIKRPFEKIIPYAKSDISEVYIIIYSSKGNLLLKQKIDIR
jgi:hypothetical protein